MLLRSHFTLPFAIRTIIAPKMIKDGTATKYLAVAQNREACCAAANATQQLSGY